MFLTPCSPPVEEADRQFFADLLAHRGANTNLARFGECLKTRRDIDTVAKDIAVLDDHVTDIDADAVANALRFGQVGVAVLHPLLHDDGAAHRVDDRGEFDQDAVAGSLEDAAAMLRDQRVDQLTPMPL